MEFPRSNFEVSFLVILSKLQNLFISGVCCFSSFVATFIISPFLQFFATKLPKVLTPSVKTRRQSHYIRMICKGFTEWKLKRD